MPVIHLTTFIAAPAGRVFDLSRSIDLHKKSMAAYGEEAVSGTRSGLIEAGENVTWQARHLGKKRLLKTKITAMSRPESFTDEQLEGPFKTLKHEHYFKPCENGTIMIDLFEFQAPYGWMGELFCRIYLTRYIRQMLEKRNVVIKSFAETEKWQEILKSSVTVL